MGEVLQEYEKRLISMRYFLLGRKFTRAAKAMEFARGHHTGLRKDGVTPEFHHQLSIAHYIRTLPLGEIKEDILVLSFVHDLTEPPYNISHDIIGQMFGEHIGKSQWLITKKHNDIVKSEEEYWNAMGGDLIASIGKGADKINNTQTMQGVFDEAKQKEHIRIIHERVLPMLKTARRKFPEYEESYENIKFVLNGQVDLINHIHGWT